MTRTGLVVQDTSDTRSFVTRQVAGETLIVPVTGSVADLESIYVLNAVAARIWELLGAPTTVARILEVIECEFSVPPEGAGGDVTEFLESLRSRRLIRDLAEDA
jgi:hypothetical protein